MVARDWSDCGGRETVAMHVLGLKIYGHDTGAALISGQRVVAIAEERLNRVKHSPNMFPHLAIDYCLSELSVAAEDIDLVVIDQIYEAERFPMEKMFREATGEHFEKARVQVINHHDAHAASAFFCSPYSEAGVVVYDGSGETIRTPLGVTATETETLYRGSGTTLVEVQKSLHARIARRFVHTFGVGMLYTAITRYLSFGPYEEGKTMGLAPYGNADAFTIAPASLWWREYRGQFFCNADIRFPKQLTVGEDTVSVKTKILYAIRSRVRAFLLALSGRIGGDPLLANPKLFAPLALPEPARPKEVSLPDTYYTNLAHAVQEVLEKVVMGWARRLQAVTKTEYLCIAGGVGLNSVANKKILDNCGFKDVWVQPACSDTGIALGAALYGTHVTLGQPRFWNMEHAYLGRGYNDQEIEAAIAAYADRVDVRRVDAVAEETAELLAKGKIVGWFQGGAEYGPRALGHRSLLVDPRPADMKQVLNDRVKHRELWRPFAASVVAERAGEYFTLDRPSPFMLLVCNVRDAYREKIPAVVHVDGTCRVQTVTKEANGIYYDLIEAFGKQTGLPMLLNTSFNLAGEPIVETPAEALRDLLATNIDVLVMERSIVTKKATAL